MNHPVLTLWGETCFYLYFAYLFLEVHFFRGHLGYLLWGVHVARIRGYIHRRTAPAAPSPQWERTDPVVKKSYTIRLDPALASEVSEPEPADDTLPSETESSEDAAAFGHPDIPPAARISYILLHKPFFRCTVPSLLPSLSAFRCKICQAVSLSFY